MWARRGNVGEEWAVGMLSDTNCLLASLGLGPCTAHHLPHAPPQLQLIRLEAQLAATYFIIMPGPKRTFASSQGHATMSPVEVDLRPSLVAVAGPSPKRARGPCDEATMSPETRRPRRKHARAVPEPEVRELRRMYVKGIMRILRRGHQQGRPSFTLEQLESEFSKLLGKPFNLATIQQPDMARLLARYSRKMQVYSDEGVTKVRLSAQEVEWVREQIRKGNGRGGPPCLQRRPLRRAESPELRPRPVAGPARTLRSCQLLRAAPSRRADLPPAALALPQQQALCSQNPQLQQRTSCPLRGGWQPPHSQSHLLRAAPRPRAVPQARPPRQCRRRSRKRTWTRQTGATAEALQDLDSEQRHGKRDALVSSQGQDLDAEQSEWEKGCPCRVARPYKNRPPRVVRRLASGADRDMSC